MIIKSNPVPTNDWNNSGNVTDSLCSSRTVGLWILLFWNDLFKYRSWFLEKQISAKDVYQRFAFLFSRGVESQ